MDIIEHELKKEVDSNTFVPSKIKDNEEKDLLPKGVGKIEVNFNAEGVDYYGLKNLIQSIENNLQIMDIENLKFNPEENTITIKFFTYYISKIY